MIERQSARLTQAGVSFGHGTTNAFDEAAWLVLWRLGLPLDDLGSVADELSPTSRRRSELIERRIATRQPAAYLTQEAWLQGVPFFVDERAIVPRSLIAEVLADGTLDAWLPARTRNVLDLCTGNGSLAVLAALAWPRVAVAAADLSADALAVARINVDRHALADRIHVQQGDGSRGGPATRPDPVQPSYATPRHGHLPPIPPSRPALASGRWRDRTPLLDDVAGISPSMPAGTEIGHERHLKPPCGLEPSGCRPAPATTRCCSREGAPAPFPPLPRPEA
jgi:ribosomal protein L3 glutamine methyltransferase